MELELHNLKAIFFKELKLHGKLEFHKVEFQINGTSIYIFKTMIDPYIFCQIVVFGYFDQE